MNYLTGFGRRGSRGELFASLNLKENTPEETDNIDEQNAKMTGDNGKVNQLNNGPQFPTCFLSGPVVLYDTFFDLLGILSF